MRVGSALLALGCLLSAEPAAAYVSPHPSLHLRHARTQLSTNAWGKHRSIGSGRRRCGIEAHSSDTVEDLRARVGDDRGTEDMSASAQAFGQWYRDAGASTVLKLSHFGGTGMRGLMATRPIEAGDELLSYPRAVTMDMSRLTDCPCADFVDAQYWKSCLWFVQVLHSASAARATLALSRASARHGQRILATRILCSHAYPRTQLCNRSYRNKHTNCAYKSRAYPSSASGCSLKKSRGQTRPGNRTLPLCVWTVYYAPSSSLSAPRACTNAHRGLCPPQYPCVRHAGPARLLSRAPQVLAHSQMRVHMPLLSSSLCIHIPRTRAFCR